VLPDRRTGLDQRYRVVKVEEERYSTMAIVIRGVCEQLSEVWEEKVILISRCHPDSEVSWLASSKAESSANFRTSV